MSGPASPIAPLDLDFEAALARGPLAAGRGWIAIDKPFWMSSHNAEPSLETETFAVFAEGSGGTAPADAWSRRRMDAIGFASALLDHDSALRATVQMESGFGPSPAHRLDVGTSGVLILACSKAAARGWPEILASAHKTYQAIARGANAVSSVEPGFEPVFDQWQDWIWPLSERAEGRRDPQGAKNLRKPSKTRVRVVRSNQWFTWLELEPQTGRTHQIRRHAALARLPILGDERYGELSHARMLAERYGFLRLALHAHRIQLPPDCGAPGAPAEIVASAPADFLLLD